MSPVRHDSNFSFVMSGGKEFQNWVVKCATRNARTFNDGDWIIHGIDLRFASVSEPGGSFVLFPWWSACSSGPEVCLPLAEKSHFGCVTCKSGWW